MNVLVDKSKKLVNNVVSWFSYSFSYTCDEATTLKLREKKCIIYSAFM